MPRRAISRAGWLVDGKQFARLFPRHLREGPYHPGAKAFLIGAVGVLAATFPDDATDDATAVDRGTALLCGPALRAGRLLGAAWGIAILAVMYRRMGFRPLITFTMQSP